MAATPRVDNRWEGFSRILAVAARQETAGATLCTACRDIVGVSGAGITLVSDLHRQQQCATEGLAATLEELQFTLGEGPSVEASKLGRAVQEGDLAHPRQSRWPAFTRGALAAGACGVFAFPLLIGAALVGVLTLYEEQPDHLGGMRYGDAAVLAGVLAETILALQAEAPSDALATELLEAGFSRAEVHQASGMVSVQLGTSVAEALVRLRAYAYAAGRPIAEVASDIVDRRLRLDG